MAVDAEHSIQFSSMLRLLSYRSHRELVFCDRARLMWGIRQARLLVSDVGRPPTGCPSSDTELHSSPQPTHRDADTNQKGALFECWKQFLGDVPFRYGEK